MAELDFDRASWPRSDALINIFFSGRKKYRAENECRAELRSLIDGLIEKDHSFVAYQITENEERAVKKIINIVLARFPEVKAVSKASPLLWLRFAFRCLATVRPPSNFFMASYEIWRFTRRLNNGPERVLVKISGHKESKGTHPRQQHKDPFLIDQFLLSNNISAELASGVRCTIVQDKRAAAASKSNRETKRCVGAVAIEVIKFRISTAAEKNLIRGLSNKITEGRYECNISRSRLADQLKKKFGSELPYAASTIIRALSSFVACPGSRARSTR